MDVANWKKQIAPDDGMVRAAFLFLLITSAGISGYGKSLQEWSGTE